MGSTTFKKQAEENSLQYIAIYDSRQQSHFFQNAWNLVQNFM